MSEHTVQEIDRILGLFESDQSHRSIEISGRRRELILAALLFYRAALSKGS